MVSGSDCNIFVREKGCNVMGVNVIDCKGNDSAALCAVGVSYDIDVRNFFDSFYKAYCKGVVVFSNCVQSHRLNIADCCCHAHCVSGAYGSCLKLVGNFCPGCAVFSYVFDHFAAAKEWRHCLQEVDFSVKGTDSHGTAELVSAHGKKVSVQVLNVYLNVRS